MRVEHLKKIDYGRDRLNGLCWVVIGTIVVSEAIPDFYDVVAGVLSWVGLTTIATDLGASLLTFC